jgi:hypothetical protein
MYMNVGEDGSVNGWLGIYIYIYIYIIDGYVYLCILWMSKWMD